MRMRNSFSQVMIACAACLVVTAVSRAQYLPDTDMREVNSYRLTESALDRYAAATRALALVLADEPPDCAGEGDESLAAMAARLETIPGVPAALAGAGLGSREYIVFGLAAFQAGMGAWALAEGQGELPGGVSPENVAFYQAHETEIQQLTGLLPEAGCEDNGDYDDDGGGEWNGGAEWADPDGQ